LKRIENFEQFYFLRRSRGSRDLGIHANKLAERPLSSNLTTPATIAKQRVILAAADILAGLPFRAALARQNVAAKTRSPQTFSVLNAEPPNRGHYAKNLRLSYEPFPNFDLRLLICDFPKTHEGFQSEI